MTTPSFESLTFTVALRQDPPGVYRVGNSRVLLELVLNAFNRGESPEGIVRSFPTLDLPDVYAVISRYLADPEAVYRKLEAAGMVGRISTQELLHRARAKGLCP